MPEQIYALPDNAITVLLMTVVVGGDVLASFAYRFFVHKLLPPDSSETKRTAHPQEVGSAGAELDFNVAC
jgi:hypothetical protein